MGLTVTFTDTSTPAADIVAWVWDFGDGFQDTVQNPVYTYAAAGTYNVTLYVFGAFGGIDHVTQPVTVTSAVDPCALTWDFTVSDQGWSVPTGAQGAYVLGTGFVFSDKTCSRLPNPIGSGPSFHNRGVRIISPTFLPFPALPSTNITLTVHATMNNENRITQDTGKTVWATNTISNMGFTAVPAIPSGGPPPAAAAVVLTAFAPTVSHVNNHIEIELDSSAFQLSQNVYFGSVLITSVSLVCS